MWYPFGRRGIVLAVGGSMVLSGLCWRGWAADKTEESATVRKTQERLHFMVPPDWPIETRGGITAPIPIEEYLGRKFKGLELQLQTIEQHLNGLDVRLRVVEEDTKKQRQGLQSSEQAATAGGEP